MLARLAAIPGRLLWPWRENRQLRDDLDFVIAYARRLADIADAYHVEVERLRELQRNP